MSDTVMIPWYATGFRADGFEDVLNQVAAVAMRYGATSYAVYRSKEDRYRYQQFATFESHLDWERYWEGPEMTRFRRQHSGWYQVPVLYGWWTRTAEGRLQGHETDALEAELAASGGNGSHTL
jgi:quinol monooxygenase YgiN